MISVTLGEIAAATGGNLLPGTDSAAVVAADVVIDSRQAAAGGLFAALVGDRADGHDFAAAAVRAGATGVLVSRQVDAPGVLVADVTAALSDLARLVLDRSLAVVVGVTGSSGKTTTKDLLAGILGAAGPTVAPVGSFNNELGLPLTVCRVRADTRFLVLEYSARGPGHIAYLCRIAGPRIAGVLNVGQAHLGEFGSVDAIAAAKGELIEAVPPEGTGVLNADDPRVAGMAGRCRGQVVRVGSDPGCDVRMGPVTVTPEGRPRFSLTTPAGDADIDLGLPGRHNATNAAIAAAMALAAGVDLATIATALAGARPVSPHRMDVRRRADGLVVVDDAYNANPESMAAALQALAALPARRRIAVLGAMRELGPDGDRLHREIGRQAARLGIDRVIAVGPDAAGIADGARGFAGRAGAATTVPDREAAAALLRDQLGPDDAVLVKASNSEALWKVAERLLDADGAAVGGGPAR